MRASTPTSGTSMSSCSVRRPWASSGGEQRRRPGGRRPARGAPVRSAGVDRARRRGRAGPRRRRRPSGSSSVGVAQQEVARARSGSRPGRAGRRRASVSRARRARRRRRARSSSARISGLASWAATARPPAEQRRQRVAHGRRRRAVAPGATRTSPRRASATSARPVERRAARRRRPTPPATASGAVGRRSVGERARRRRPASSSSVDLGLEHLALARPSTAPTSVAERLGEAVVQRAELEEVEQLAAPRRRRTAPSTRSSSVDVERRRRGRSTITSALRRTWASCSARFWPQLRRLLVDVGEDAVEAAVGVDELGRRLLAHPGHAGQVVGRVAPQRGVLRRTASGVTPVRSTMPASS